MDPETTVSEHPKLAALYVEFYQVLSHKEACERRLVELNGLIAQYQAVPALAVVEGELEVLKP